MIQRIQSVYLLIVTILQAILFFSKQAMFINAEGVETPLRIASSWSMAIFIGITALLALFTIFLYRNRTAQLRLVAFNTILLVLLQGVVIYSLVNTNNIYHEIVPSLNAIFPIVSAVISYLAVRGIKKDEEKIRALNRLR